MIFIKIKTLDNRYYTLNLLDVQEISSYYTEQNEMFASMTTILMHDKTQYNLDHVSHDEFINMLVDHVTVIDATKVPKREVEDLYINKVKELNKDV